MSPPRALPWCLLACSLAAHAWLYAHRPAPASTLSGPKSPPPHTSYPFTPSLAKIPEPAAPATPPRPPAPTAHTATYSAYADILARSLETPEQHDELARVLGRWIASDPASASEWLNRQPDDPRYDLPVSQVAIHLTAKGNYALAREWADSIRTPEVRVASIEEILAEQYRRRQLTPAALADAAARAGLPPDRVQGILSYSRLD